MKQTSLNPDNNDVNPRNRNDAYPNAIAMSVCTQNELLTVHVSISFSVLAIDVPAALADNSRYAKIWSWPKSNQTCKTSGKSVAPLEISQTEADISNREYVATIAFEATTNLKVSKWYQRGESPVREVASMKIEEARENEKEVRRKTRMSELKRRSLCSATVEWKRGAEGERLLSATPL